MSQEVGTMQDEITALYSECNRLKAAIIQKQCQVDIEATLKAELARVAEQRLSLKSIFMDHIKQLPVMRTRDNCYEDQQCKYLITMDPQGDPDSFRLEGYHHYLVQPDYSKAVNLNDIPASVNYLKAKQQDNDLFKTVIAGILRENVEYLDTVLEANAYLKEWAQAHGTFRN